MSYFDSYLSQSNTEAKGASQNRNITMGVVVDTNDPQQRHRVRVVCSAFGDDPNPATMDVEHLPWALVSTIASGFVDQGFRENGEPIENQTEYGLVAPPKVGAQAIVATIDGNASIRVVLGYINPIGSVGSLPHGKFKVKGSTIDGPLSVEGTPIQPLYSNAQTAFSNPFFNTGDSHGAMEWMSRGADKTVSAHGEFDKGPKQTDIDDQGITLTELDGTTVKITQGYAESQMGEVSEISGRRDTSLEPQTSCWVSPGFHAIAMDDRAGNTRIRLRTSGGHQILLDDTNERLYVATNKGRSWVELDTCGNIDVFSETRVSVHAADEINLSAGNLIRMSAKQIHMKTTNETRITAGADVSVHSNANIRMGALQGAYIESGTETHIYTGTTLFVKTGNNVNINAGASVLTTSTGTNETKAGGNIVNTAPKIFDNSGVQAQTAPEAVMAAEKPAYHANRIPQHEPWPRMMIDTVRADMVAEEAMDAANKTKWQSAPIVYNGSDPSEFEHKSYTSKQIGRVDRGVAYVRNKYWHR